MAVRSDHYAYTNITAAATTQVKSGVGVLKRIVVNTSTAGTITVVDNTAGTTPAIALVTALAAGAPVSIDYDIKFSTGLRVITSATVDITVVYA